MGTTLTGTTPQDTYDSLIKVTDNGPLTGSLKKLTDGLGNDSSLSLSTAAASLSGTLAVTGASTFSSAITMALGGSPRLTLQDTDGGAGNVGILFQESTSPKWTLASVGGNFQFFNEVTSSNAIWVSSTNNVGIGTSTPTEKLSVHSSLTNAEGFRVIQTTAGRTSGGSLALIYDDRSETTEPTLKVIQNGTGDILQLFDSGSKIFTVKDGGQVGIGVITPAVPLDVVGNIRSSTGILFGTDTAAANLLDDYEEGTWTMGISFGGASVGVTADNFTGTYTKIGRQVTVNGYLALTSKGSSSGDAQITGLPFTIGNGGPFYSVPSLWLDDITFANVYSGYGVVGDTKIDLYEFTEAGVISSLTNADFANGSRIMLSITYFV